MAGAVEMLKPTPSNPAGLDLLPPDDVLFGKSQEMRFVRRQIARVCSTNVPLLLVGETGTGKEILARYVHARSAWNTGEFVKINCAAIPGLLLESELFGYEKGGFTGAHASKPGRVESAHHGTLFLDGIRNIELGLQAKLLQFLQDGHFCRIGDHQSRHIETRVICSTDRDLRQEVADRAFRSDLYYRINVITIRLPKLAQRSEDLRTLAEYYRQTLNTKYERSAAPFSADISRFLETHSWPGNIRELENWVARYVLLGPEEALAQANVHKRPLENRVKSSSQAVSLKRIARDAVRHMERDVILKVLQANRWNRRMAAKELQISYRALMYKIRSTGLGS